MDTRPTIINKLINDLHQGRNLVEVVEELTNDHRALLVRWVGACMGTISEDVNRAARYLSQEIPHHATMFEDVCIVMKAAIPGVMACDYASSAKRHQRMVEMMYWAMFGYSGFLYDGAKQCGQQMPDGLSAGMSVMTHAVSALSSSLRMVRHATSQEQPEKCARMMRCTITRFVRILGQVRDGAAHVDAVVNGTVYSGAFGNDGQLLRVGSAAQELFNSVRGSLIDILTGCLHTASDGDHAP